ncbi:MAG: MFS transporter [Rectinemataceae bacterium]
MNPSLSPSARITARRNFDRFNIFNASSFVIVAGSLITLLALRLGASASYLGLINALTYVSFFFMPLGKRLVEKRPIVSIYFGGWLARTLLTLPVVLAALVADRALALALLFLGVAGFNVARGVGMIGNNPVIANLAEGGDRGAFISRVGIFASLSALATNLLISLALGGEPATWLYAVLIGSGIAIGIVSLIWLRRIPEPEAYRPEAGSGILTTFRLAMREAPYRRFMAIYLLLNFTAGMGRSFLPVWAKSAWLQGDGFVMALSFIASLAGVVVGLLSRLVLDRLGAKPLFAIFGFIALLGFAPAILMPDSVGPQAASIVLIAVFFVTAFGFSGQDSAGQTYYFGIVPRERTLDLAVAYFIANGVGGTLGSLAGGLALDGLALAGLDPRDSYRIFYGAVAILIIVSMVMMRKLVRLGSASIRESIGALLSLRDLRAFDLISRLERSGDQGEALALIRELGRSGSARSQRDIAAYLSSPRFEIRTEALLALEALPDLDSTTVAALRHEVSARADTTGYIAARILGKRGALEALPDLRAALLVADAPLRGSAALALARLGDTDSIPAIEELVRRAPEPRLRIQAAGALERFASRSSLPTLVAALSRDDPPAFVSDELVLAMASISGIGEEFWPLYEEFSADVGRGLSLLGLMAAERIPDPERLAAFEGALRSLFPADAACYDGPSCDGSAMARLLLESDHDPAIALVWSDALLDAGLDYRGFRFLAAAWWLFGH